MLGRQRGAAPLDNAAAIRVSRLGRNSDVALYDNLREYISESSCRNDTDHSIGLAKMGWRFTKRSIPILLAASRVLVKPDYISRVPSDTTSSFAGRI